MTVLRVVWVSAIRWLPRSWLIRLGLLRSPIALLLGAWVTLWLLRSPIALLSLWAGVRTVIRHSWRNWRVEPGGRGRALTLLYQYNSNYNTN